MYELPAEWSPFRKKILKNVSTLMKILLYYIVIALQWCTPLKNCHKYSNQ